MITIPLMYKITSNASNLWEVIIWVLNDMIMLLLCNNTAAEKKDVFVLICMNFKGCNFVGYCVWYFGLALVVVINKFEAASQL